MAFEVKKIAPLDLQPRKAVGVSLPFSGKAVFNSNYQTKDALKTNLINYFLTSKGERYMNPEFGNSLQTLLFEQLTEAKLVEIESTVKRDLEIYFPQVVPTEIKTDGDSDNNLVQFSMKYFIAGTGVEDDVTINFLQ